MFTRRQAILLGTLAPFFSASQSLSRESVETLATALAADKAICAIAVSILKGGVIDQTFQVSGCTSDGVAGSIFQAASLSKPVVASIALNLVDQKLLELDAPVSKYVPGGYAHRQNLFSLNVPPVIDHVPIDILRTVTLRHLMTHTSGFPNWASSGPLTLDFAPGSRWQYSGEGYVLLQTVMETITGMRLEQLAEEKIFTALQMRDTSFKLQDSMSGRLVKGTPRQLRFPTEIASSSLYTTAKDYALFLASVLNDKNLIATTFSSPVELPRTWRNLIQSTHLYWGLGWGIEVRDKPVSIWHWGSNPGFRSLVLGDLQTKNGVVVLTSTQSGMSVAKSIVNFAVPGEHPGFDLDAVQ